MQDNPRPSPLMNGVFIAVAPHGVVAASSHISNVLPNCPLPWTTPNWPQTEELFPHFHTNLCFLTVLTVDPCLDYAKWNSVQEKLWKGKLHDTKPAFLWLLPSPLTDTHTQIKQNHLIISLICSNYLVCGQTTVLVQRHTSSCCTGLLGCEEAP